MLNKKLPVLAENGEQMELFGIEAVLNLGLNMAP